MDSTEIRKLYNEHWRLGWGAIAPDELEFVQSLIQKYQPKSFLEVGMASGMSTGFIANFLEANSGESLVSIDHDDTFFGDPSKPNGFLVDELYHGTNVDVRLVKHATSLDLGSSSNLDLTADMAFVDANHQHPWPTIDTLAIWPHMTGPKVIIHHDLNLYMTQDKVLGIGPKFLYDQVPHHRRSFSDANNGNIFYIDLDIERAELEEIATQSLKLPWSIQGPLSDKYVTQITGVLRRHYSPALVGHFERCLANNLAMA